MERRASKPKAEMDPSIFSIPRYVLMEILSKLPVTTICNCRFVCSYFRNLIADPQFVQLHLSISKPHLLFCSFYPRELSESFCSVEVIGDTRISGDIHLKFEPGLKVLSSCNGLICFYRPRTYDPYLVCNPVIDENVIVPQIERYNFYLLGSGFGFCPRTNRYKVLRFVSPSVGVGLLGLIRLEAEINTLGTNLWRRVGDAPVYLHSYSDGCFLNGAHHWIVHDTENFFDSMHCFDFGNEQFQPFPGPSEFYRFPGRWSVDTMKMGVLKGDLSLSHHPAGDVLDIWVMKGYAVQDSWTKDFVIELPWVVKPYYGQIYHPLMVLSNGDILMHFGLSDIVYCNVRDRSIRKVRYDGMRSVTGAVTYIPSFVSIRNAA